MQVEELVEIVEKIKAGPPGSLERDEVMSILEASMDKLMEDDTLLHLDAP